ncbi:MULTISPECIES: phosphoribosyltransferase [Butyricimonas]|uniref:phosphoribosyltransferase n=1 Tax=Butyricimonas TaxID=574697 RepID=UPI001D0754D3|nr:MULTISPECIES: phosphoribosyltransferase family protein [Butyricimonas]MCB6972488.1 hypoxanthine phosphoribosyltransferase [Butyricimonas synergistica]MCG4519496.1 hypoxanthine phosphoribosyltransferase [Butyricimonas sp. DFI.6.44]
MKTIRLHDRDFRLLIGAEEIEQAIDRVARQMNKDLAGESPLFIGVLNGAFMFVSDLLKKITVEGTEISFVKIASYDGLASSGNVQNLIGLKEDIAGRTVVILEDMVDSGESMVYLKRMLEERNPKQVKIAAMFYKPGALRYDLTLDYTCIALGNDFVVGRGLDYDGLGRNLPDLYTIES